jgi:hypothetical protein
MVEGGDWIMRPFICSVYVSGGLWSVFKTLNTTTKNQRLLTILKKEEKKHPQKSRLDG